MERFKGKGCIVAGQGPLAEAIAARLNAEGGVVVSISDVEQLDEALARLSEVSVLVTAFSVREDGLVVELDEAQWQRILDGNLTNAFIVSRDVARRMVGSGAGVIVHVGSDIPLHADPGTGAYAAAKAGVHLLTTGMALDLAPHGVRVCAVASYETGLLPEAEQIGADDVAAAVAFCASDHASYVLGSTFFPSGSMPLRG